MSERVFRSHDANEKRQRQVLDRIEQCMFGSLCWRARLETLLWHVGCTVRHIV